MSFIRSTTLRASSMARAARPSRYIRTAELQPWQRAVQRRTYASGGHGGHGAAPSSDLPWMAASVVGTATGLYIVVNQDLSHGAAHDEHHDDHHAAKHEPKAEEESTEDAGDEPQEEKKDESSDDSKDGNNEESKDGPKHVAEDGTEDNSSKDVAHTESREIKAEAKKAEKKDRGEVDTGDEKDASPDKSDKANPRKQAKSSNETSGKQEGISNDDTHHTSQISKQEEKSKKGEGVAETAKLKGTVSTNRPGAENKEERGKGQIDKDA